MLTHRESIVHHSWGLSLLAYVVDSHKVAAFSNTKQTQWNTNQINPTSCFLIKLFNTLKKIYDRCTKMASFVCQYVTVPFNNTETLGQVVQSLLARFWFNFCTFSSFWTTWPWSSNLNQVFFFNFNDNNCTTNKPWRKETNKMNRDPPITTWHNLLNPVK